MIQGLREEEIIDFIIIQKEPELIILALFVFLAKPYYFRVKVLSSTNSSPSKILT